MEGFLVGCLTFLGLFMLTLSSYAMSKKGSTKSKATTVYTLASIWSTAWLIIGFFQTVYFQLRYRVWTAPPFRYPSAAAGDHNSLSIHSVFAFVWLAVALVQPLLLVESRRLHRTVGKISGPAVALFLVTAVLAQASSAEPTHEFIWGLQVANASGVAMFYLIAMYQAYTGNIEGHKDTMIACIVCSSGPGTFRVLRTIREMYDGRFDLSQDPSTFACFEDVISSPELLYQYQAWQNTLFGISLPIVGLKLYLVYVLAGRIQSNWWKPLVLPISNAHRCSATSTISNFQGAVLYFMPPFGTDFDFAGVLKHHAEVCEA
ncbi:unnamed protein product [Chrysoparadoxa australica]